MSTFWVHQPVLQNEEKIALIPLLSLLPTSYQWIIAKNDLHEVYVFLTNHYGEDKQHQFRFHYSEALLQWYFVAPGTHIIGVRSNIGNKPIVAIIVSTVCDIVVDKQCFNMTKINFL